MVGIHHGERVDVVALALRFGADALSLGDRGGALGEIFRRRRDVRIPQQAQRDAPIGDSAFRIGLEGSSKVCLRSVIPERMLVQHRAVETPLCVRFARCFEMHLAELFSAVLPEAGGQATSPRRGSGNANDVLDMAAPFSSPMDGRAAPSRARRARR